MRIEHLTESKQTELALSQEQANQIIKAGNRLASDRTWWGGTDVEVEDRSIISCQSLGSGRWKVRVHDAVGIIAVSDLQIIVHPKIPQHHFFYLLAESSAIPRLGEERGWIKRDESLWELVATWYLNAAENILRKDLLRDYAEHQAFLPAKRGQIIHLPTARAFYSGRFGFESRFEEFTTDTPLNRTLKAAADTVMKNTFLPRHLRRRAKAVFSRMKSVGKFEFADLRASIDRRSSFYADGIKLAKHIIRSQGRSIGEGRSLAWTFLLRTPEAIEEGIRTILTERLAPDWQVTKKGKRVAPGVTFNPDLVFDQGIAVGDVKYKLIGDRWHRPDLNQIVAFGTAYEAQKALVIGFSQTVSTSPIDLQVGRLQLYVITGVEGPVLSSKLP